jgi:hypothetical protein
LGEVDLPLPEHLEVFGVQVDVLGEMRDMGSGEIPKDRRFVITLQKLVDLIKVYPLNGLAMVKIMPFVYLNGSGIPLHLLRDLLV